MFNTNLFIELYHAIKDFSYEELIDIGLKPKEIKELLAFRIVDEFHSEKHAIQARENFIKTVVLKLMPDNIPVVELENFSYKIPDLINAVDPSISKTEARRLIKAGAVQSEGLKVVDPELLVELDNQPTIIKVGKRKYFDIRMKNSF